MRRLFLLTFSLLLVLVAITAALTLYLANDEDFLKGQARKYVFELTGRQLSIDGPLELTLGRETTLQVSGIRLSNAAWAGTPDMATAGLLKVGIDVPSLFDRLPVITEIVITDCSLEIVRNGAGDLNWDVLAQKTEEPAKKPKDDSAPLVPVLLKSVSIRDCGLLADGPDRETPLVAQIGSATLQEQAGNRIIAAIDGSINDETLTLEGWLEPASVLQHGGRLHLLDLASERHRARKSEPWPNRT